MNQSACPDPERLLHRRATCDATIDAFAARDETIADFAIRADTVGAFNVRDNPGPMRLHSTIARITRPSNLMPN